MSSSRSLDLSEEAEADLFNILAYSLATWGEVQRDSYAVAIDSALRQLVQFPEIGRDRPELFPRCRSHRVKQHVIYYRVDETAVRIVRILHVRMDAARHFKR